jgi:hypothetical protein
VADYRFLTMIEIPVSRERVWAEVAAPERWVTWWPGLLEVRKLQAGDAEGRGALLEFVFRSRLPYTLSFRGRVTRLEVPGRMDIEAVGELQGLAVFELDDLGRATRMRLTWTVKTTKIWMNLLAPIARPFFVWNHDVLMKAGARGLARKLGTEVTRMEPPHPSRRFLVVPATAVAAVWLWKRARPRIGR